MASLNQVSIEFVTQGEQKADKALKDVARSVRGLAGSQITAATASNRLDAQRRKETQTLEQLRRKYVQGYAAMEIYSREMNDLARARQANIISAEQQRIEVERLNKALADGTIASQGFGGAQRFAGRNVSKAGVLTQQAGYQVGDFIVQVQSGTNAFVAFGQQATQVAGTLTLLGGKFVAIGTVLGIAIPLVTAIAAGFMRARQEADETADSLSDLDSSLKSLDSTLKDWLRSKKAASMGITVEELLGVQGVEQAEQNLKEAQDRLKSLTGTFSGNILLGFDIFGLASESLRDAVRQAEADVKEAEKRLNQIRSKETLERDKWFAEQAAQTRLDIALDYFDAYVDAERESLEANQSLRENQRQHELQTNLDNALAYFDAYQEGMQIAGKQISDDQKRQAEDAAAHMKAVFENTVFRATLRFSMEYNVPMINQDVVSGALGDIDNAIAKWERSKKQIKPKGGAGSDPAEEYRKTKEAVDQLRASYDEQYATQLKVQDAQRKVNELIALNPELTDSANQILKDYIASLEKADDTMSQFVNDTASQMSDALMSIVDGSKSASDAFKDMARAILKQAFELAVINPIMNSIFGSVSGYDMLPTFANGGAFNAGRVVPFANGGVVSSPTTFPMAGRQTGLMGEAGPEAIMPLKRTKGGKLGVVAEGGGQQPVVINQSFNFAANGDESVKRIIAQEAPKIANLTQKQILDQRARGGAFRATFG